MKKSVIADEQKTGTLRRMAREQYEKGRIGKSRMELMIEVADELDIAKKELSFSRNKGQETDTREFLVDILKNETVPGKKYDVRIPISDGGDNSYIGLSIYTDTYQRKSAVVEGIALHRHSNSVNRLVNTWKFRLGGVCNTYADYPEIAVEYSSYGKSSDEATTEAQNYFRELRKLIRKQTSDYRIAAAAEAQDEREKLLSRLSELDKDIDEEADGEKDN